MLIARLIAALEWQARSWRRQSRELVVACQLEGLVRRGLISIMQDFQHLNKQYKNLSRFSLVAAQNRLLNTIDCASAVYARILTLQHSLRAALHRAINYACQSPSVLTNFAYAPSGSLIKS